MYSGCSEAKDRDFMLVGCRIKRITIHRGMKCIASLWELGGTRLYKELHDAGGYLFIHIWIFNNQTAYKDANCVILMCDISGLEKIEVFFQQHYCIHIDMLNR